MHKTCDLQVPTDNTFVLSLDEAAKRGKILKEKASSYCGHAYKSLCKIFNFN